MNECIYNNIQKRKSIGEFHIHSEKVKKNVPHEILVFTIEGSI